MKLLQKNKIKNNLNTEHTGMGVFSAVAGNQLPNPLQKRVLPALFHLRCPSHTSDDSYIYQLLLVLATAAVSYYLHQSIASTQQQASWNYDARIFRDQLQPCQPFAAAESIAEGGDFVFLSQAYRNNTTNLRNGHRYCICPVKPNGYMGLHVYAHSLVKLW